MLDGTCEDLQFPAKPVSVSLAQGPLQLAEGTFATVVVPYGNDRRLAARLQLPSGQRCPMCWEVREFRHSQTRPSDERRVGDVLPY